MVARISSGSSPGGAVCYNEEKVKKGQAERLAVRNFEGVNQPVQELKLATITAQLIDRAAFNERVSKPTFHVSLSLAQGEKPSNNEMLAIADQYMNGMGYGRQPYVVYQHHDTDHTHVHIVSVRVKEDGKRISDAHERNKSNKLRQTIEKDFGLQVAEKAALRPVRELKPVEYGKGDLKRDISTVVNGVLKDYRFSSFAQFNQILSNYNVKATEVTTAGKKPGLVYSVIDRNKVAQGATFRASSLPLQPTMEVVERRMKAGKKVKEDRVAEVRKVTREPLDESKNWDDLQRNLIKVGILLAFHFSKEGNLFGLSYMDTQRQTLYSGSELGKSFTAGSLKASLGETVKPLSIQNFKPDLAMPAATDLIDTHLYRIDKHTLAPEENTAERRREFVAQRVENEARRADRSNQTSETPVHNIGLVRQLLHALGEDVGLDQNDQELKTMLKNSRSKSR